EATIPTEAPVIGFIAHMDTSPDSSGQNVNPRVTENYGGGEIVLGHGKTLSPSEFPDLKKYTGQDIITADGGTLLGADDKAGVAEIMAAMEYLKLNPDICHGKIRIAFTPDEEIGRGVDHFDVEQFGAAFAYTVDGGELGELETENFNAARAIFEIEGKSVHTGSAKGIMINAGLLAVELAGRFPKAETPAETEGDEGFYHLLKIAGEVEKAKLVYLIRDFDRKGFEARKNFVEQAARDMREKYGQDTIRLRLYDEYYNMAEKLTDHQLIIDVAWNAMEKAGVKPRRSAIRGGTDGSRLCYMGLPCPNLFTGGHNFHGHYEYIPLQSMMKAVEVIVNICRSGCEIN
ncbi:MAG: peptidase T, partial [Clostridiales bacterium]|nr:peptidase T [Clostridiales bacterium]